ncbi:PREDICTED: uncharacterized protein LOC107188697, partial [Dufourea novaeangliae]|uniref:uncharacterized protein LOC107188697 n=1 Tax=Dufourea novaeangliae TaxID=178035 RepID=UPI0007679A87
MSEKTLTTDILQLLPFEKWQLLQNKTTYNWPTFAYYYYWIENAIKWKKKRPNILIEIYCPNGDVEKGIFIGIARFALHLVILFALEPNKEMLKKVITETDVINWNQGIYFAGVHECILSTVLSAVEQLKSVQNIEVELVTPANFYFKSAKECAEIEVCITEECYIKALDKSDVATIHSEWPHKDLEHPELSTQFISTLVEMNGGVGLYLKKDDTLVSWAIHNDWHGIGMVQTLEQHKRKGYAKTVINELAKNLGMQGISVTLFIVEGNATSETLFRSLSWKRICRASDVIFDQAVPQIHIHLSLHSECICHSGCMSVVNQ